MQFNNVQPFRFLIHDRDTKFGRAFDEVFRAEGIKVIHTPVQAPNANAFAERWVRTVRADCLDRILILGRRHLGHVLGVYRRHYNEHRPHRALQLLPPNGRDPTPLTAPANLRRRDLLGGLIHDTRPREFANPTAFTAGLLILDRRLGLLATLLALLLAFARIYVGVHYPSDVAAGPRHRRRARRAPRPRAP